MQFTGNKQGFPNNLIHKWCRYFPIFQAKRHPTNVVPEVLSSIYILPWSETKLDDFVFTRLGRKASLWPSMVDIVKEETFVATQKHFWLVLSKRFKSIAYSQDAVLHFQFPVFALKVCSMCRLNECHYMYLHTLFGWRK